MPPLPWVKFSFRDFFNDPPVRRMTHEEVGFYLWMLAVAWDEKPPASLPKDLEELSRTLKEDLRKVRRFLAGPIGLCWPERDGLLWNPRLAQQAEEQTVKSANARRSARVRWDANAYPVADANAMPLQSKSKNADTEKERSKPKPFSHSENGHLNAPWPDDLIPVKDILEKLGHLETLGYVDFWAWVDARTENTGVFYDEELKNYLGWWKEKPPSRRHKNLRKGFRNWIEEAIRRWEYAEKRRKERAGKP